MIIDPDQALDVDPTADLTLVKEAEAQKEKILEEVALLIMKEVVDLALPQPIMSGRDPSIATIVDDLFILCCIDVIKRSAKGST